MTILLALSHWIHLLTTIIWLGGMALMGLVALPAWRKQTITLNQWLALQQRLLPWVNGSMVLLWITGFFQMTQDTYYNGFLAIDNTWSLAIMGKHIAILMMMGLALYTQFRIYPALERLNLLKEKKPDLVAEQQQTLHKQEIKLLRLNLIFAALVLLCTAIATAV